MINPLDISRRYCNMWVVLDPRHNVVDHGPDFAALRRKYANGRHTFYFANGQP